MRRSPGEDFFDFPERAGVGDEVIVVPAISPDSISLEVRAGMLARPRGPRGQEAWETGESNAVRFETNH